MKPAGSFSYTHKIAVATDEIVTIPNHSGRKSARFLPTWLLLTAHSTMDPRAYLYLGGPRQRTDGRTAIGRDLSIVWVRDGKIWLPLRNPLPRVPEGLLPRVDEMLASLLEAWK